MSIGSWLIGIFLLVVLAAVFAVQYAMRYQEDVSIRAMAEVQARRASELVFENLYSVMSRGWTREDMHDIIARINSVEPGVSIEVHRSAAVAAQFGDIPEALRARTQDGLVRDVFATGTQRLDRSEDTLRFVYPLVADDSCGGCHAESSAGTVNGVIDMTFPVGELRVPLEFSLRMALYALMATLGVLFLIIFLQMRLLIVRPIIDLARVIRDIVDSDDMGHRVAIRRFWPREVRQLAGSFNGLMQEVEENRLALVERALRDPLTGLSNRRQFDAALAREVDRAGRYGRPISVLLADLDGFKPVNDRFGHAAGDRVLVHVARLLRAHVRGTDVAARIGGDEFAILLPETDRADAERAALKLQEVLQDEPALWEDAPLPVGMSIGIATSPAPAPGEGDGRDAKPLSAADLLARADAAMYAEKAARKTGRPAEDLARTL